MWWENLFMIAHLNKAVFKHFETVKLNVDFFLFNHSNLTQVLRWR